MNYQTLIPGMVRGVDPAIPKQVLESRLKIIDKRRAEIKAALSTIPEESYHAQELKSEAQALADMRVECEQALNPKPMPCLTPELARLYAKQHKRDILFIRATIKQQRDQVEYAAQREEAAGNHRSARLHRLTIPTIPETVCREFGKDLTLLAEIED